MLVPQILLKSNTTGYAEELKVRYVPPSYEPKSTTKQLDLVAISCENMATITTQQALNCCTMVDDLNFIFFSFEQLLLFLIVAYKMYVIDILYLTSGGCN